MALNKTQIVILSIGLSGLIGYGFGRYVQPAKIQIQEKTVEKEKIEVDHNTVTETHEEKKPDGTIVTDTTVKDLDVDKTQITDTSTTKETITNSKPQWRVQGLIGLSPSTVLAPTYGLGIERRIVGPISAGAWGTTNPNNNTVGISLSVEF